ncbi:sulfatase-like hydrolase/transferase [Halopiger goleimassiliensis]|uniref:sulfatase-like hydrolase/transferase n=1 Tax=Halopiger goleimassiliensis TaxID=1293048 RepID=UPI0006782C06|nr:sulfatase-like hydrolase/transferase [Halopiger goleimassiliensis]
MERNVPLRGLETNAIENVYVFVADSVRYDELPDRVADRGRSFKMAASALCTPQAMSSIATGRYAPRHGVTWFNDSLNASMPTVFDLEIASGYNEVVWDGRAVGDVLGEPGSVDLETVEEPFVLFEHDNGGHSPYVGYEDRSTAEMFAELSDCEELRDLYRRTVEASTDRFEERLRLLEERGLRENTLVIYLADHGELLGEHGGFVGHGLPSAPEVAYVPAVFVHPSLGNDHGETFLQHVDLFPTIRSLVGGTADRVETDGKSLLSPIEPDRPAYTQGIMRPNESYRDTFMDPNYDAPSVWTADGGYVFNETSTLVLPLTATYDALFSGYTGSFAGGPSTPKRLLNAYRHYLAGERTYGEPSISKADARGMAERISSITVETETRSLDEETKAHLEQLGYR